MPGGYGIWAECRTDASANPEPAKCRRRMNRWIGLAIVLALVGAACGDASTDPTRPTSTSLPPASSSPTRTSSSSPLEPSVGIVRAEPVSNAPVADVAGGFNDTGFDLLRTQEADGNIVLSPVSVAHALLMARGAADEPTGAAIDAALRLPEGSSAHEAWNALDQAIAAAATQEEDTTVIIADRIWPRLDVEPDQVWIDLLATDHGADVVPLDFEADPDGSTAAINDWISDQTQGLIPDLLPPGFIASNTVLVLTDAIYYKARWQQIFGKYGPVTDTFTSLDDTTRQIQFMQELELPGPRGSGDGFVGAEIAYAGGEFSMLVIVPELERFEDVRDRLSQTLLDEIDATFTTGAFELRLPKWSNTTQIDLLGWLTEIGAAPGNYPLITEGAFLGAAVHGADIEVDEWGTVAAAASAFGFDESAGAQPELTVWADRPFFYVIRHVESGLALFAGQVTDPS